MSKALYLLAFLTLSFISFSRPVGTQYLSEPPLSDKRNEVCEGFGTYVANTAYKALSV